MPSTREVILEFVEGASHDSVGQIESFLNTITVMNIDIDVQNSLICFKQLKDGQYTIIDVTESRGFWLFGMMEPARPVESILGLALSQNRGTWNRACSITNTVVIEPFHDRAIFLEVKAVQLILEIGLVLWGDIFQQVNVLVGVETGECLFFCLEVVQFGKLIVDSREVVIELILADDFVGHCDSQRFHWMTVRVVESTDHLIKIINAILFEFHLYCLLILLMSYLNIIKLANFGFSLISNQIQLWNTLYNYPDLFLEKRIS